MSDKNPYYSVPKALGEPKPEIEMLSSNEIMEELRLTLDELDRFQQRLWRSLGYPNG